MCRRIILFLFINIAQLFPQESNKGLVLEIPFIKTELKQEKYSGLVKIDEVDSDKYSSGINIGYSWRIPLPLNTKFEIRPGVFLSDLDLVGVNLGIYLRGNIIYPVFANLGIKAHYNFGFEDSHISWGRKSQSGFYFNPVLSLGMPISNKFSIMIGYSYYLEKNWRKSWSVDYNRSINTETSEKLNWLLNVVIEFSN